MKTSFSEPKNNATVSLGLSFQRGDFRFAVPMSELMEIKFFDHIRPMPMSQRGMIGLVCFRDRIIPVFDPLPLAGLPAASATAMAAVTRLNGEPLFALLADNVGDRAEISEFATNELTGPVAEFFTSTCKDRNGETIPVTKISELAQAMGLLNNQTEEV